VDYIKNKIVLITGGTSGIGKAIVLEFLRCGAVTFFCSRDLEKGRAMQNELSKEFNENVQYIKCDISKEDEVANMIQEIQKHSNRLDFAINNAGISGNLSLTHEASLMDWSQVLNVNVLGTFLSMKYELKQMLVQKEGTIVNVSSALGIRGKEKLSAYVSSKHAIIGLTKSAALEYGPLGIRINAVCPGGIYTEMDEQFYQNSDNPEKLREERLKSYALRRMGYPEEIAKSIIWLCSPACSFMTGSSVVIDGGKTAK
jgi:NAD(P)-dependent dehydrogenase (short-subunit alcohol dehydrogenase family)